MCIERNWQIFIWGLGVKAAVGDSSATGAAYNLSCQILLHLPLPAKAGLVHCSLSWP
jgi:hypothetical protein